MINEELFSNNQDLKSAFLKDMKSYKDYLSMLDLKFNPIVYTEDEFARAVLDYVYTDDEINKLTNESNKIEHNFKLKKNETVLFAILKQVHTDVIKFMLGIYGG